MPLAIFLAALLAGGCGSASHAGRPAGTPTATTPPVVTPTATTPPRSAWHIVPSLENVNATLAPSDPRIAYLLAPGSSVTSGCPLNVLSASDDDGAHWSLRTIPSTLTPYECGGKAFVFLHVSPVQPQVLILAASATFPAKCPPGGSLSLTSAQGVPTCAIHLYSADGGQTWRPITLPTPGVLMATPQARGNTLFDTVELDPDPGVESNIRLVASRDGGQTWQAIDGALVSVGQSVVSVAPVPASSMLYAVTSDMTSLQAKSELWRSDDDGAHWQHLPTAPAQVLTWVSTGVRASDHQLVLYLGAEVGGVLTPQTFASMDGGNHWSAMPSAGIDIAYPVPGNVGVLADGSLLESFNANPNAAQPACAFYAWTPGQSQVQVVGTQLSGQCGPFLLVPSGPAGANSLWAVYSTFTPANSETAWLPLANA